MTSLFSSFDFFNFFKSWLLLPMLLCLFFKMFYKISFSMVLTKESLKYMQSFLNSLNDFNFSKGKTFLFLMVMAFIFTMNVTSIFPFNFALTSQVGVVMGVSLVIWFCIITYSMIFNFKSFMKHLIPEGAPFGLALFLFLIELVSSFIRPVTLTVRLLANILAGHLLIILLSSLVVKFNYCFPLLSILNLIELMVSLIQSYIFVTLVSLYYSEM